MSHCPPRPRTRNLFQRRFRKLDDYTLYARSHLWLRQERDGLVRLGLDPLAAWVVGRLRCVVLLPSGMRMRRGDPCAWLDQVGGTLTIRSPLSGQVVEPNEAMVQRGEFEMHDPMGCEWLLLVRPWKLDADTRESFRAADFQAIFDEHVRAWKHTLHRARSPEASNLGPTLQDGGHAVATLDDLLGPSRHHRVAARLLRGRGPHG